MGLESPSSHDENLTEQTTETTSVQTVQEQEEMDKKIRNHSRLMKFLLIFPSLNRSSYILRIVAGGYVAYLAVQNLTSLKESLLSDPGVIGVLSLLMLLCGVHLLFSGAYAIAKEEYRS